MNRVVNRILSIVSNPKLSSDSTNAARTAIALVLFIICAVFRMPNFIEAFLLAVAAIICGTDIISDAIKCVEHKIYISEPLIILLVEFVAFVLGYKTDVAASLIIYQLGRIVIAYIADKTQDTAYSLAAYQSAELKEALASNMNSDTAGDMELEYTLASSVNPVLKIAMVFAVLYAILLPIITSMSFTASLRRALIILIITVPSSVTFSIPLVGITGIGYAAQNGVLFKNASALEKFGEVKSVVIDKHGIFSAEAPRVISIDSDVIDKKTFINFVIHAVYYSEQPFAKAIGKYSSGSPELLDVLSDFKDIPGIGVELKVNSMEVIFATEELFASRGISIPVSQTSVGTTSYYMTVSGRYVGKIDVSDEINTTSQNLVYDLRKAGVKKCILLTEDSNQQTEKLADDLGLDAFFSGCDSMKKYSVIEDLVSKTSNKVMFMSANGSENHSAATIDCRVGSRSRNADMVLLPEFMESIPKVMHICERVRYVASENALFVFVVKAILIFLAINGMCTIWFAVFMDAAAVIGSELNCIRVTGESLLSNLKSK